MKSSKILTGSPVLLVFFCWFFCLFLVGFFLVQVLMSSPAVANCSGEEACIYSPIQPKIYMKNSLKLLQTQKQVFQIYQTPVMTP